MVSISTSWRERWSRTPTSALLSPTALPLVLIALAYTSPAKAWQPDYVLRLSNASVAADCTVRHSVTVNGSSPGPLIRVQEGQHVWIRVHNDMVDRNTTLHWHGVTQYMSPFADGTPQTSQWPIAPLNYFDYEFMLDKGSAGTYFYHTHVDFELVTAFGAFIVDESPTNSFNPTSTPTSTSTLTTPAIHSSSGTPNSSYDEELTLLFGDFYHASDTNITVGLADEPFTWLNDPQTVTVNGHAFGECTPNSTDPATGLPAQCEAGCHTEIVSVKPGKTYRVRTVGTTVLSFLYMRIEDHANLTLTEVDAQNVRPFPISYLQLDSGQRYSFLLRTKTAEELEELGQTVFWANIESRWRNTRVQGAWLLQYDYELESSPNTQSLNLEAPESESAIRSFSVSSSASATSTSSPLGPTNATVLATAPLPQLNLTLPLPNETESSSEGPNGPFWAVPSLEPLDSSDGPPGDEEVSRRVYVEMRQLSTGNGSDLRIWWSINGYQYTESYPSTPYLVQAYAPNRPGLAPNYTAALANEGFDNSTKTFPIRLNETIDFVFLNEASYVGSLEAHPWHFHGRHPWLMAMGLGNFTDDAFATARANMSGKPIRRDTQVLFPGPYAADYNVSATPVAPGVTGGWMVFRLRASDPGAFLLHCHTQPHFTMGMGSVFLIGMDGTDTDLPSLPAGFVDEFLTYNATPRSEPQSYFDLKG